MASARVLVVDDEEIARKVLCEELQFQPDVEVIGQAANGMEALAQIAEKQPDIVFLDLQMPAMGGFEVIRSVKEPPLPVFVVVTAFNQHAIQAFENGAVDYLLKPVSESRLAAALQRARVMIKQPQQNAEAIGRLSGMNVEEPSQAKKQKVVGKIGEEFFLLDVDEVLAFQADGEMVWIVTAKNKYLATQPLRAIEARLAHLPFQRVHRNAIVNVNHIRKMGSLSSQRWLITLSNSSQLIVSKRQAHSVKQILRW